MYGGEAVDLLGWKELATEDKLVEMTRDLPNDMRSKERTTTVLVIIPLAPRKPYNKAGDKKSNVFVCATYRECPPETECVRDMSEMRRCDVKP